MLQREEYNFRVASLTAETECPLLPRKLFSSAWKILFSFQTKLLSMCRQYLFMTHCYKG